MRISDWSSDVCSSDLVSGLADQWLAEGQVEVDRTGSRPGGLGVGARCQCPPASGTLLVGDAWRVEPANGAAVQVRLVYGLRGAQDRKSVVSGKRVSGRVVLGGSRLL